MCSDIDDSVTFLIGDISSCDVDVNLSTESSESEESFWSNNIRTATCRRAGPPRTAPPRTHAIHARHYSAVHFTCGF